MPIKFHFYSMQLIPFIESHAWAPPLYRMLMPFLHQLLLNLNRLILDVGVIISPRRDKIQRGARPCHQLVL